MWILAVMPVMTKKMLPTRLAKEENICTAIRTLKYHIIDTLARTRHFVLNPLAATLNIIQFGLLKVPVKNETSPPSLRFLLVPHPVLYDVVALYDRLHLVEGQFQAVPDQFFLQFMVLLKVELQQISRADHLRPLHRQLPALVAEQHFLQHRLARLADALHEPVGDLDLAGEDDVEVFDLISCLVELEGRIAHEDAAHLEEADVDDAVVAQEEGIEGLEAEDRFGQVLLVALLDRPRHQLNGRLESPARLLDLLVPQVVLQVVAGLRGAGVAGQLAGLELVELGLGAVVALLGLDHVLLAGERHRVVQLAAEGVGLLGAAVRVQDRAVLVGGRLERPIVLRFARRFVLLLPRFLLLALFLVAVDLRQRDLHALDLLDLPRKLGLFEPYELEDAADCLRFLGQGGEMPLGIEFGLHGII